MYVLYFGYSAIICGFFNVNKIYINTNTDCHLFKNMMITGFM